MSVVPCARPAVRSVELDGEVPPKRKMHEINADRMRKRSVDKREREGALSVRRLHFVSMCRAVPGLSEPTSKRSAAR